MALERFARGQGDVLSRRQLYERGLTRAEVRAEIKARRWRRFGDQCVLTGPGDQTSRWWRALFEVGPRAVLDGVTALQAAGMTTITDDVIHVAIPKSASPRGCRGVRVHETRRYRDEDVIKQGIPRMTPATASVHAALWARSPAQAALFVVAPVQQRLVSVPDLAEAVALVKKDPRRKLLRQLVTDVSEGIQSIGERDFARACKRRGFPKPTRQEMRRLPSGRVFYDVTWAQYRVRVELDGLQHLRVEQAGRDALKQNAATIAGDRVLRVPFYAFRADPEPFLDQVEAALRAGGWQPLVASA
jgi:very-short-patch-repair endonuclease